MSKPGTLTVSQESNQNLFTWAVVLSMVIWGCSWPSSKILSGYTNPETIAFIRFVVVFITLFPVVLFTHTSMKITRKGLPVLLGAAVFLVGYNFLYLSGLQYGTAGSGGIMVSTLNPILTYLVSIVVSRRSPNRNESIGLVLGFFAGIFLIKVWASFEELLVSGNLYFLGAALTWAILSKITAKSSKYGTTMGFSLWLYLATAVLMSIFIDPPYTWNLILTVDRWFWVNMLVLAFLAATVATTLYFYATVRLGADRASSFIFLVPIIAGVSAFVILGEVLEWNTAVGGVLGIAAVTMINRK